MNSHPWYRWSWCGNWYVEHLFILLFLPGHLHNVLLVLFFVSNNQRCCAYIELKLVHVHIVCRPGTYHELIQEKVIRGI